MKKLNGTIKFLILMALAMLTWGGSWTSAKLVANTTAPEVLIFWRFLFTFISLIPVMFFIKKPLKLDRRSFLLVTAGSVFLVAYNKLFFSGLRTGLAGGGGVLVTTLNPVVTFTLSALLFRQKIRIREGLGLFFGLIGGMFLIEIWNISTDKIFMSGNIYFLLSTLLWAALTIASHKADNISSLVFSFYVYGFSALMDLALALPFGVFDVMNAGYAFWLNMFYLSAVVTTFGTTVYFYASSKVGANKASTMTFLVPSSAVLISWMALGEQPKLSTVFGGLLALSAVYIINLGTNEKTDEELKPAEIEDLKSL